MAFGFALLHLLVLLLVAATAYGLGRRLLPGVPFADRFEEAVFSLALGLGGLGLGGFVLGLGGLLRPGAVVLLVVAIHLWAFPAWRELLGEIRGAWRCRWWLGVGAWLLFLAPVFTLALYPPTAFDSTVYHLPTAKAFASAHALPFVDQLRFPVFPHLNEVLFAMMLLLVGDVGSQLIHLLQMLLVALALVVLGRRLASAATGWWAAALWLGNPIVVWLGAAAYVDLGLCLFVVLGVGSWLIWRGGGVESWLWLSAALLGLAASTKYLGLLFVVVLGLGAVSRRPLRRSIGVAAIFFFVAFLVMAPWYGRIVYHTGNPLFPFLTPVFGDSGAWQMSFFDEDLVGEGGEPALVSGFGGKIARRLEAQPPHTLFWRAVFDRGSLHDQPPISPFFLLLLPPVLVVGWGPSWRRRQLLLALVFFAAWYALPGYLHHLLPALVLLCLPCASLFGGFFPCRIGWTVGGRPGIALAALLLAPGWGYACLKLWQRGPVPVGQPARDGYLEASDPLYGALRYLNDRHGESYTVYALFAEHLAYGARGRFLGDWFGPAAFAKVLAVRHDSDRLAEVLRQMGADYLLLPRRGMAGFPPERELERHFRLALERPTFVLWELRRPPSELGHPGAGGAALQVGVPLAGAS